MKANATRNAGRIASAAITAALVLALTGLTACSPDTEKDSASGDVGQEAAAQTGTAMPLVDMTNHANALVPGETYEDDACLACHGDYDELAAETADLMETKLRYNPHESHYDDGAIPCTTCHSLEETPELYCSTCHVGMDAPEGWTAKSLY